MERTSELSSPVAEVGAALGAVVAAGFGALAWLRGGVKALHPRGVVTGGRLTPVDHAPTGVEWADELVETQVVVRSSRSAGLPSPLPDIIGLALRIPLRDDGFGDLLLASSRAEPVLRYLAVPRVGVAGAYTSLLPFATPAGLRLVAALPGGGPGVYWLAVGSSTGDWTRFAILTVDEDATPDADSHGPGDDEPIDFEPVGNQLPGLAIPEPLGRFRYPSYAASRAQRRPTAGRASS